VLEHLVLDTICSDGRLIAGVPEKIGELIKMLNIHIVTADTHGKARETGDVMGLTTQGVTSGSEQRQKLK
jgi:soluble P-type ATPase